MLEKLHKLVPDSFSVLNNLAAANHQVGKHKVALQLYRRCLGLNPRSVEALRGAVASADAAGNSEAAIGFLRRLIELKQETNKDMVDLSTMLLQNQQAADAFDLLDQHLGETADDGLLLTHYLALGAAAGDPYRAEQKYLGALDRDPQNLQLLDGFCRHLENANRMAEAVPYLRRLVELQRDVQSNLRLANAALVSADTAIAEEGYRRALELDAQNASAMNNLGLIHAMRGERELSEACYRRALEIDPVMGDAWRNLSALKKFEDPGDTDIQFMRAARSAAGDGSANAVHIDFALGKALEDCAEYSHSFEHYQLANRALAAARPFDTGQLAEHCARIRSVFTADFLETQTLHENRSVIPVQIVGLPRTGTSLLEQILSGHPKFCGGGELLVMNHLVQKLEHSDARQPYPECVPAVQKQHLLDFAAAFLDEMRQTDDSGQAERISDKMPFNFFHLGLFRILFPGGRIIECRRGLLDTCISAYFNYFPRGLDYTSTFDDLAAMCRIYQDMMDHWRACGLQIQRVEYESLVAEPEAVLLQACEFLGLQYMDELRQFHQSNRPVRTISAWQVRQPLNPGRVRRHQKFIAHLSGLNEALKRNNLNPDDWLTTR